MIDVLIRDILARGAWERDEPPRTGVLGKRFRALGAAISETLPAPRRAEISIDLEIGADAWAKVPCVWLRDRRREAPLIGLVFRDGLSATYLVVASDATTRDTGSAPVSSQQISRYARVLETNGFKVDRDDLQLTSDSALQSDLAARVGAHKLITPSSTWPLAEALPALFDLQDHFIGHSPRADEEMVAFPFPIAAPIWQALHLRDPQEATDRALASLEAVAQFVCAVLLSRLGSSGWPPASLLCHPDGMQINWSRTAFGVWVGLMRRISKAKPVPAAIAEVMPFVEQLGGRLTQCVELRNVWKGHGGAVSGPEADERRTTLEQHLRAIHAPLLEVGSRLRLVVVTDRTYSAAGSFDALAEVDADPRAPRPGTYFGVAPTYHLEPLLPLVQVRRLDGIRFASWFFSRLGPSGPRFIAHALPPASQHPGAIEQPDDRVAATIESLNEGKLTPA